MVKNILIYGAGGVGLYLAARLALAGQSVTLKARDATVQAARQSALLLQLNGASQPVEGVRVVDRLGDGRFDIALIATKSWQVAQAAAEIAPHLAPGGRVLTLQNGVDAAPRVAETLPPAQVLAGILFVAVARVGVLAVQRTGPAARLRVGSFARAPSDANDVALLAVLSAAGVDCEWVPDIRRALWKKLSFIATFGGIGALSGATAGQARAVPQTRALFLQALQEAQTVAQGLGVGLDAQDLAENLHAWEHGLSPEATASLQRDLAAGRPSELEDQSGAIVRHAARLGLAVPIHETIYASQLPRERSARAALGGPVD